MSILSVCLLSKEAVLTNISGFKHLNVVEYSLYDFLWVSFYEPHKHTKWHYFIIISHFGTKIVLVTSLNPSFSHGSGRLFVIYKNKMHLQEIKPSWMLQKEHALTFEGRIRRGSEQWTVGWTEVWATLSCMVWLGHSFNCVNSIC